MVVDVRRHLSTGGTLEDRRSFLKVKNVSSRSLLSPPTFGDEKAGFVLMNKSKGNKVIVIKDGRFVARREPEVIRKWKSIIIEEDVNFFFKGGVALIPSEGSDASPS
ncbi:hypothetical protein MA16_Dca025171 [Dendrobium catenatum]|uniref:Uncharacterized protein n=1 Tax=Dendrobium catenatum TaxID=906689 RepID=A0A2I0VIC9_9ASPA|nr:hypothetical protein MA16_Dca025171 [Dendrobium catenatum]